MAYVLTDFCETLRLRRGALRRYGACRGRHGRAREGGRVVDVVERPQQFDDVVCIAGRESPCDERAEFVLEVFVAQRALEAAARVRDDPAWKYYELATGHDCMITDPKSVIRILLENA